MTDAKYVKKAPRQSNLELSRILAMYLIVMHHFSVHAVYRFGAAPRLSLLIFTWISCFPPEAKSALIYSS